jgi:hypothetical protein
LDLRFGDLRFFGFWDLIFLGFLDLRLGDLRIETFGIFGFETFWI